MQPGPLRISSVPEVMKESKQPVKSPKSKPQVPPAPCEEKEGNS